MDAAKLADELRTEQETAQVLEKEKREMEAKTKDIQVDMCFVQKAMRVISKL